MSMSYPTDLVWGKLAAVGFHLRRRGDVYELFLDNFIHVEGQTIDGVVRLAWHYLEDLAHQRDGSWRSIEAKMAKWERCVSVGHAAGETEIATGKIRYCASCDYSFFEW